MRPSGFEFVVGSCCMNGASTKQEQNIHDAAVSFAKKNKKAIAKRLTSPDIYPAEAHPVSVFMAGSPGAGKTEASIALLETIGGKGGCLLRIDPDDLRHEF